MKIITVTNQKGGAGKTTTVDAALAGLTLKGYKVLALDLDPQCNLSFSKNADLTKPTVLNVMTKDVNINDAIQHTASGDIILGDKSLATAEMIFTNVGKEYILKEVLSEIKTKYDYILLDTPPALGIITINALTCCDYVVIPAQADIYSVQGIDRLAETIKVVKQYTNKSIKVAGILLTRYSDRSVLSKAMADYANQVGSKLNTSVMKASIREAIAIKEAQMNQTSIFEYAGNSKVAEDYMNFTEELIGLVK